MPQRLESPTPSATAAPPSSAVSTVSDANAKQQPSSADRKSPVSNTAAAEAAVKYSRTRPNSLYRPTTEHPTESLHDQWLDARKFLTTFDTEPNAFALLHKRALRYPTRTA